MIYDTRSLSFKVFVGPALVLGEIMTETFLLVLALVFTQATVVLGQRFFALHTALVKSIANGPYSVVWVSKKQMRTYTP